MGVTRDLNDLSKSTPMPIAEIDNEKQDAPLASGYSSSGQEGFEEGDKGRDSVLVDEKGQRVIDADGHSKEEDEFEDEEEDNERRADVERVISVQPNVNNVSSIPNGGLWAWLQVLGAFFLFFNSWGIINTFGSYQAYYKATLLSDSSPSAISWIGSIQAFLLLMVGALSGPIYDAGYFHHLLVGGSLLLVIGQVLLSFCTTYWQVLLAQAICIGIGCGALFVPSVAILNTYFTSRISSALGLAASGSSFGGVIYPIVFHKLAPRIGFAWTTRSIALLILITQLVPNLCMRVRILPAKSRSLLDLRAFLIPAYALDVLGFFIGFIGLYMPFFYAQVYAIETQIASENFAFYLLAIMNATSTFGRIIPNFIADLLGPFNVVIPFALITAVLCFSFIAISSSGGMIVLIAFYGFFSGAFVSLPPAIIVSLSQNERGKIGTRLGQSFACLAVGVLIGTPIGGAILGRTGSYEAVWAFAGSTLVVAAGLLMAARLSWRGWRLMVKA